MGRSYGLCEAAEWNTAASVLGHPAMRLGPTGLGSRRLYTCRRLTHFHGWLGQALGHSAMHRGPTVPGQGSDILRFRQG